jgi:hypothetical protein
MDLMADSLGDLILNKSKGLDDLEKALRDVREELTTSKA